jgi:hypothetical protein
LLLIAGFADGKLAIDQARHPFAHGEQTGVYRSWLRVDALESIYINVYSAFDSDLSENGGLKPFSGF